MDRRNIEIDFVELNCKKEEIDKQIDRIIKGEIDGIQINNIPSSVFEDLYDVDEITDFNGWQCDWWSKMTYKNKRLDVGGCAWYATVGINRTDEDFENFEDEAENFEEISEYEDATKKVDVYHDTSVMVRGRMRNRVLPVKDNVSLEEAENLVKEGKLQKYYIWRTTTDPYSLIYSPDENSARVRILAIWGDFNEIENERGFQEKCDFYKKGRLDVTRISFSGNYFVLDTSFIVNLSEKETLSFLKETDDVPHDENRLRTDELNEAIKMWEEKHGYAGKIINVDEETARKYFEEKLEKGKD